jgi:hypothetical protein
MRLGAERRGDKASGEKDFALGKRKAVAVPELRLLVIRGKESSKGGRLVGGGRTGGM